MVSVLLLDFGGTLDGPLHWLDRFLAQYRAAGIDVTREELDGAFEHATQAGYRAGRVIRRFGMVDLIRFLVGNQVEFLAQQGPRRLRARFASSDAKGRHRTVGQITAGFIGATKGGLDANRETLEALKRRFRIGVLSNFYGNLDRILQEAGMMKMIDSITDSSQVGIFKPHPGIFEAALRGLGVPPAAAAMVGDSPEKDCVPAHRLGLTTVWYRAGGSGDRRHCASADHTIASFGELENIRW
jgi:putative hydrolase of the HAD superfamily